MALSWTTLGHSHEQEEDDGTTRSRGNDGSNNYSGSGSGSGNYSAVGRARAYAVEPALADRDNYDHYDNGGIALAVRTRTDNDEPPHERRSDSDDDEDEDLETLIQQAAMHFGGGGGGQIQMRPNPKSKSSRARAARDRARMATTNTIASASIAPTNSNRTLRTNMNMNTNVPTFDHMQQQQQQPRNHMQSFIPAADAEAPVWSDEDERNFLNQSTPGIKRVGGSLRRRSRFQLRRSGTASSTTSSASSKTVLRKNGGMSMSINGGGTNLGDGNFNGNFNGGSNSGVGGNTSSFRQGSASMQTNDWNGHGSGSGLELGERLHRSSAAGMGQRHSFSFSQSRSPFARTGSGTGFGVHNNFNFSMRENVAEESHSHSSASGSGVGVNMNMNSDNLGPGVLIRRPGFQQSQNFNFNSQGGAFRNTTSHDEDEDEAEIAACLKLLPKEYKRLSNRNSRSHSMPGQRLSQGQGQGRGGAQVNGLQVLRQRNSIRNSNISVDSSLMPGNMSGVIPRKRRSHTDIADAAAAVAAYFHNLSEMDEDEDDADADSSSQSLSLNGNQSHSSRRSSSGTKRGSGASTTGFSRLSIHNNYLEERPRKRRSSSSSVSRIDDSVHRLSAMSATRRSFSSTPFGNSNMTAFNAASAAVAADEATQRLSETMDICGTGGGGGGGSDSHIGVESSGQSSPRRKFERRAGFVVSSIETEAAAALASRTELLKKDRYEKQRRVRGGPQAARRSMSYTSGIKMSSSIIASNVPEDGESVMDNPEVKTDLINLTRSRMERRVLSLPDQNAVTRLSQTSINEDVDFSGKDSHKSSGLSQNLEASSAALRRSYNQDQCNVKDFDPIAFLRSQNLYNEQIAGQFGLPPAQSQPQQTPQFDSLQRSENSHNSTMPLHPPNVPFNSENSFSPVQPQMGQQDISILAPSLQVAAQVFNTNALAAQSLAQTAQVALSLFHEAQKKSSSEPRSAIGSWDGSTSANDHLHQHPTGSFDYESFDGKISYVEAFEPDTPEEVSIAGLIHQAAQLNDTLAVETIVKSCKEATRMLESESDTGNVPLHTAIKHGSHDVMKMLLESDSNCASIRNIMGNTPLHIAVDEGNLAAAITICSKSPKSARIQCEEGFLPLHNAVWRGARHPDAPQITTMLLQTFEEATHITTDEGLLPIHYSSMSGFTAGIRTLLSAKFDIISSRDNSEMMLPLDFAIDGFNEENTSDVSTSTQMPENEDLSNRNPNKNYRSSIELILASTLYDRMITISHSAGEDYPFLPLHGAVKARPTLESWKSISILYHSHALDTDTNGGTATHVLCSYQSDDLERDIGMINTVDPNTFLMRDDDGFLPVHRALLNRNVSFNFVEAVISRQKSVITAEVRSNDGSSPFDKLLPVQLAALHKCDLNIIFELMRNTAGILSHRKNGSRNKKQIM